MGYRALLIEDNPDHALLARRALLRDQRVSAVDIAATGREAVELLEDEGRPLPDLILVDLRMPGMTGLDFIDKAKSIERAAGVPVVVVSTSAREQEVRMGLDRGACAFISKPLRVDDLMNRLSAAGALAGERSNGGPPEKKRRARPEAPRKQRGEPSGGAP